MAECDDDEGIGLGVVDLVDNFGLVGVVGFDDGGVGDVRLVVLRPIGDGGWCEFTTSACGSIGLGDDGGEVVGAWICCEEF